MPTGDAHETKECYKVNSSDILKEMTDVIEKIENERRRISLLSLIVNIVNFIVLFAIGLKLVF